MRRHYSTTRQQRQLEVMELRKPGSSIIPFPVHRRHGLSTISDLVREYLSIRESRGLYRVPLPNDLTGGQRIESR